MGLVGLLWAAFVCALCLPKLDQLYGAELREQLAAVSETVGDQVVAASDALPPALRQQLLALIPGDGAAAASE